MSSACLQHAIRVALSVVDLAYTNSTFGGGFLRGNFIHFSEDDGLVSPHDPLVQLAAACALRLVDTLQSCDNASLNTCLAGATDAHESLLIERTVCDEQYRALVPVSYRMSRQPLEIFIDAIE